MTKIAKTLALLVCLLAAIQAAQAAGRAQVMVVATMHGLHAKSTLYSYDILYELLRKTRPDYVGVEIRQEDMARDPAYLAKNYPKEMIEVARQWGPHAFGFDWLGDDVANAPIPEDWWKVRSPVKRLERELDADPALQSAQLDAISAAKLDVLANATPASLNDGRYDRLNDSYYGVFHELVSGSKYQPLSGFYADRDRHIAMNIAAAIKAHPGARFAILTGADHRSALLRELALNHGVALIPVP
jgi:hypothetical protein